MTIDSIWQRLSGMDVALVTAPTGWDGWLTIICLGTLPFLITYLITLARASWVIRYKSDGGVSPPMVPYAVPFAANTFSFATDTRGYIAKTLSLFGEVPFRLSVGADIIYYIPHGELVQTWLKNSRRQTLKPIIMTGLRAFGLPPKDMDIYRLDESGDAVKPAPGFEDMNPDLRVLHITLRDIHGLVGAQCARDALTDRVIATYTKRVQATTEITHEWTTVPDFYAWFRNHMFHAMIETLCGTYITSLNPNFCDEFWAFDRYLMVYMRLTPRWLAPTAHRTRDKAIDSIKKWRAHALQNFNHADATLANTDWEPLWGSQLMRARSIMIKNAGFSPDGGAAIDLGMMWAGLANVIPSTFWTFLGIQRSGPSIISRIRAETTPCFDPTTGVLVDKQGLFGKPLLGSCYMESLRYSATASPVRAAKESNIKVGNWTIKEKNAMIISMPWFGANDPSFWNQGRRLLPSSASSKGPAVYQHPVDTFWPERFLKYPDDPLSGPVAPKLDQQQSKKKTETAEKTPEDDVRATLVAGEEIQNNFYPYGSGTRMCPGRFFAKQILMGVVAIAMNEFEFEFDGDELGKVRPDLKFLPMGNLPPDRVFGGRVRRRVR